MKKIMSYLLGFVVLLSTGDLSAERAVENGQLSCLFNAFAQNQGPRNIYCMPAEGGTPDGCGIVGESDLCLGNYTVLSNFLNNLNRESSVKCQKIAEAIRCRLRCNQGRCEVLPYTD